MWRLGPLHHQARRCKSRSVKQESPGFSPWGVSISRAHAGTKTDLIPLFNSESAKSAAGIVLFVRPIVTGGAGPGSEPGR